MIAGERFLFRGRTVWKLDYGEEYVKKVSSRRNETEKVSVLLHPLSISLFLWTKNNKSSRNRFRSPPLRNNRINAGYPDGGFSAGVCLFRRLRRLCARYRPPEKMNWMDGADVCEKLGISKRTLQTYRDRGLLPYSQINHKIYYRTEDVEAFVEAMSREMTEDE